MGVLSRLNVAVFTVPLVLSSLLLRALQAVQRMGKPRKKPKRGAAARRRTPETAPAQPHVGQSTRRRPKPEEVKAMRRALTAVLDGHEGSREVFRYLGHFEHRLARQGLRTLEDMPTRRLRRALAQFEAIVTNWSSPQLADLRSRMAVAVTERDSGAAMWAPAPTISKAYRPRQMPMLARPGHAGSAGGFHASRQVEVEDDLNISRFEAAVDEWHPSHQSMAAAAGAAGPVTH
jgi:hypothetical protein